jgi:dihydrofolate synthase / folylpolyglutamate synthase
VLRDHSALVLGRVGDGVRELAERTAAERSARLIVAGDADPKFRLAAPGAYQRRNFAVATAAAEAAIGGLDPDRVEAVAEGLELPGRVQLLKGSPPLILDAAHNPDGARALAEALPEAAGEAPVVACIAILADKDAAGILAALAPRLDVAVCTELPAERLAHSGRPGARSLEAVRLAELAEAAGMARTEVVGRPEAALRRAVAVARERGGATLVTGSHYLLGYAAGTSLEADREASGEREVS